MAKKEFAKRLALFIVSLFFMGLGVALTKHAGLGVSPISSVANVISIRFEFLSFGMWLTVTNCALLLGQILILRKRFNPFQLLQIPLSFLFGYFTDLGMLIVRFVPTELYIVRTALVLGGILVLGFGISLGVTADVILNSGEAFVKAISDVTKKEFGIVKVIFDVSWVLFSIILSLLFFKGKICGVREGTIVSAFLVGFAVKLFRKLVNAPLTKILKK